MLLPDVIELEALALARLMVPNFDLSTWWQATEPMSAEIMADFQGLPLYHLRTHDNENHSTYHAGTE
jgi:hypothetical protein